MLRRLEGRITRLCLGNTWAWPVNGDFHFEWLSKLMGGPAGRFAANRYAVFVHVLMPASMKRRNLTQEEMRAFRAPFRERAARRRMHGFSAASTGSREWLSRWKLGLRSFKGPVSFVWAEKDFAFREKELAHRQALLPQAQIVRLPNCGRYLWTEAPEECAAAVRALALPHGRERQYNRCYLSGGSGGGGA
jgi:haloalkane dehalogenase